MRPSERYKDPDYRRLEGSWQWQKLRLSYLKAHPVCEKCAQEGRTRLAEEIHHVIPVSNGLTFEQKRSLCYDPGNLMALCKECHHLIHDGHRYVPKSKVKADAEEKAKKMLLQYCTDDENRND